MQLPEQVGAVVHRDLRRARGNRGDVLVVGVDVLSVESVDVSAARGQRDGNVVLGRERIRGAERHVGAARQERPDQVGGLARHVQAGADADAGKRPLRGEAVANAPQHRHLPLGPVDPGLAGLSELGRVDHGTRVHGPAYRPVSGTAGPIIGRGRPPRVPATAGTIIDALSPRRPVDRAPTLAASR